MFVVSTYTLLKVGECVEIATVGMLGLMSFFLLLPWIAFLLIPIGLVVFAVPTVVLVIFSILKKSQNLEDRQVVEIQCKKKDSLIEDSETLIVGESKRNDNRNEESKARKNKQFELF